MRRKLSPERVVRHGRPADLARELLEQDGPALGLDGMSEIVREALRLLHRHAREHRAAAELAAFHPGGVAPCRPAWSATMSDAGLQPLRGEVWDTRLPVVGQHPAVVFTSPLSASTRPSCSR